MKAGTVRPFTGRHFTAIIVVFFVVVIAVNLLMARYATSTFGGVVVENSYVASQQYNKWLDEARQEATLGWSAQAARLPNGRVALTLAGAGSAALSISAVARHPLGHRPDQALRFEHSGDDRYVSTEPLAPGRWRLRIKAVAGQQRWRNELEVQ